MISTRLWKYSILFIPNTCILLHTGFWWRSAGCLTNPPPNVSQTAWSLVALLDLKPVCFIAVAPCCSQVHHSPFPAKWRAIASMFCVWEASRRQDLPSGPKASVWQPHCVPWSHCKEPELPRILGAKGNRGYMPRQVGEIRGGFLQSLQILMSRWGLISFIPFWFILILMCLAQDEKEKHDDEVDTKTGLEARIRVFHSKVQKQTHGAHRADTRPIRPIGSSQGGLSTCAIYTTWCPSLTSSRRMCLCNSGAKDVSTRTQKKGICACGGKWHGSTSLLSLGVRQKGCRTKGAFTESTTCIDRHIFILVQWCSFCFWRNTLLGQGARGFFSKTGSRFQLKHDPRFLRQIADYPLHPVTPADSVFLKFL